MPKKRTWPTSLKAYGTAASPLPLGRRLVALPTALWRSMIRSFSVSTRGTHRERDRKPD